MHKVVTINLNGRAYQLDEPAFVQLRAYLDQAETALKDSPDRDEILADLEQAIGEKCSRFLSAHKTVVGAAEVEQVLTEMGPVEAAEDPSAAGADGETASAAASRPETESEPRSGPRRLYRIREGAMFAGVCTGLAAYLSVDVVFVRLAVLLVVLFTHGFALLGYWLMVIVIPEARTADEHAAAHGHAPFSAKDVVEEAKRAAASVAAGADATRQEWRRHFKAQRRHWRSQARAWRNGWEVPGVAPPVPPVFVRPFAGLASVAMMLLLAVAFFTFAKGDIHVNWWLPLDVPWWVGLLLFVMLLHIVLAPARAARAASRYGWPYQSVWLAMWESLFGTALMVFLLWLLVRHLPPVDDFGDLLRALPDAIRGAAHELVGWFRQAVAALREGT